MEKKCLFRSTVQRISASRTKTGTALPIKKRLHLLYLSKPDLAEASVGQKIRYLRRKINATPADLAASAGVCLNTLLRVERDEAKAQDWVLSRILIALGDRAKEVFPEATDIFDFFFPATDFGTWLKNFRLRKGLQQVEMGEALGVSKVSICRYEQNKVKPKRALLEDLRRKFNLNGELDKYI